MRIQLLFIVFLLPSLAFSQGLFLEADTYNFGVVSEGRKVKHNFVFFNKSKSPISIIDVVASCGCTVGEVSKKVLEPSERGVLGVTFDTEGFWGRKSKVVQMLTNDPQQEVYEFKLDGQVRRDVEVEPTRLYLGEITQGQAKTDSFVIKSATGIQITEIKNRSDKLFFESKINQDGDTVVSVTTAKKLDLGLFRDRIIVKSSSKKNPVITVPVVGRVVGELVVDPPEISYGLLRGPLERPVSVSFKLTNRGPNRVDIVSLKAKDDALFVEYEPLDGGSLFMITVILEDGYIGTLSSEIVIKTTHPDQEQATLTIPVNAIVVEEVR